MIKLGFKLMVICFFASLVLAFVYQKTKPVIELQRFKEEQALLREVLPQADSFKERTSGSVFYYEAGKDNKIVGYILKTNSPGYGGDIKMLVGIDPYGTVEGVAILEHSETPGLGANISEIKKGDDKPWFLEQFEKKEVVDLDFGDIDTITGATISSKAVFDGVKSTAFYFLKKEIKSPIYLDSEIVDTTTKATGKNE